MKDTLVLFGQTLGKRQTDREKLQFINAVAEQLMADGIKVQLHKNPMKRIKSNNLLAGDMDHCRNVFLVPYDTGRRMLIPSIAYRPLDDQFNQKNEKKNLLLYAVISIVGVIGLFLTFPLFHASFGLRVLALLLDVAFILMIVFSLRCPSAPANMNRNSASVALAASLAKTPSKHTSFIFTDQSIESHLGLLQVKNWYHEEADSKLFIILDAISDGEQMFVAARRNEKSAKKIAEAIGAEIIELSDEQTDHSPLRIFNHAIMISGGHLENGVLTVDHSRTNEDYHVNPDRIEQLYNSLSAYIKSEDN
ncbi:MAG: hypothetical protein EOM64_06600 [Erysipelotrichia bacterium]|nr:hypothetical protein [Erysipelotrichia bacterium]